MKLTQEIRNKIEEKLEHWGREKAKFIIFPYGEIGVLVKNILQDVYNIEPSYCLDNKVCKYNEKIKPITFLGEINADEYILFLATTNLKLYEKLKKMALHYVSKENVVELLSVLGKQDIAKHKTEVGKYSYGPLTNHGYVERVGAFCSIADGCDALREHPTQYISTHPFIYYGNENNSIIEKPYNGYAHREWYFPGVTPQRGSDKLRRITIGNDVWLGKNVLITNGSNIGNGVIAAAGAVITKDVPDYAVVAGVPARIIRYRYTPEQIAALNRIQWWNWTDDEIRDRYDDFYIDIEEFIKKYDG